ncbi:MAG: glycosyltransferase family 2 protein [Deltaproteobacteria bacterium]|nr:glycosyltransferase family 2 protein [Deltaproteobacteria bacterium]
MSEQVQIIIVNWNGRAFLEDCLQSLRRQSYRSFSVTLVDNASTDGSLELVSERFPEVQVIALTENRGFAEANNCALRDSTTPYVALLNNDAVADPYWLESLVETLEQTKEAGFAASKMLYYDRPGLIDRCGDGYTRAGVGLLRGRGEPSGHYNRRELTFGACAGAALYRTSMLKDVGFFDGDFFLLYEDVDLSFRSQLKGYTCLYVPEALVYHRGSGSLVHDSSISVYYGHRNLEWVYIKNMPARLIPRTIFFHIIYDIIALCYFVVRGRGIDYFRAKKDALKGLKRVLKKRRQIQDNRTVDDSYVWGLLDRPALTHRLRGRRDNDPCDDYRRDA